MTPPVEKRQGPQREGVPQNHFSGETIVFSAAGSPQESFRTGEVLPRTYDGVADPNLRTALIAFEPALKALKEQYGESLTVKRLRSEFMEGVLDLRSQQIRIRIEQLGLSGIIPFFNEKFETLTDRVIDDETIRAFYAFRHVEKDFPAIPLKTRTREAAVIVVQKLGTDPLKDVFHISEVSDSPRKKHKQPEDYSVVGDHIYGEDTLSGDERALMKMREEEEEQHHLDFDPFYTPNSEDDEDY